MVAPENALHEGREEAPLVVAGPSWPDQGQSSEDVQVEFGVLREALTERVYQGVGLAYAEWCGQADARSHAVHEFLDDFGQQLATHCHVG